MNQLHKFFKRHQKLAISLLGFLLVVGSELGIDFVVKNANIIAENKEEIRDNKQRIDEIEVDLTRNTAIIQQIVTRESFNAFIRRVDEERHSQVDVNNKNQRDIGVLMGRVNTLDKYIYRSIHDSKANVKCPHRL